MSAYYNEHDPKAAAWLRELINRGLIAPGFVDERSIEDVIPDELAGYTQCHFFAGIGVWSYALRQAGWDDDRRVWTGSCPCQPFSAAGKRTGTADERHLWPAFFHLISQCRPDVVFGEQVASKDGLTWLDLVRSDLEGASYAVGAADLCAAGFGAPHIRQRLYWVADASGTTCQWDTGTVLGTQTQGSSKRLINGNLLKRLADGGDIGRVADTEGAGEQRESGNPASTKSQRHKSIQKYGQPSSTRFLADPASNRQREGRSQPGGGASGDGAEGAIRRAAQFGVSGGLADAGDSSRQRCEPRATERRLPTNTSEDAAIWTSATNGFWRDADWLYCRDGKWRPVESGTFPLVDGAAARVGRLRGYGNAIVAPVAVAFIESYLAT